MPWGYSILNSTKRYIKIQTAKATNMKIYQQRSSALPSINIPMITRKVSLLSLGVVAAVFSISSLAQDDQIINPSVNEKTAYTHINKSENSLLNSDIKTPASSGNMSLIKQIGDRNTSTVNQNRIIQGNANFSSIYQSGNLNNASINQEGSQNIGLIYQDGNRLEANITQIGNQFEAQVTQYGLDANVNISQSGSGYRSINVEQQSYSGNASPVTIDTYWATQVASVITKQVNRKGETPWKLN